MRRTVLACSLLAVLCCLAVPVRAGAVAVPAAGDATLIESPDGALADGRGSGFRAGRTSQPTDSIRRGLIRFDVAAHVPRGAQVTRATLILFQSGNNAAVREVTLHRALGGWGEGPSASGGGSGAPATPGDATWLDRFHNPAAPEDSPRWRRAGGDFRRSPSAAGAIGGPGYYAFDSAGLARDVQAWIDTPRLNAGWVVLGDETTGQTSKLFVARDSDDEARRPLLLIEFAAAAPLRRTAID